MPSLTYTVLDQPPVTVEISDTATAAEQTAAIQAALDAVGDGGGGTVALSAGTFTVEGTGKAADGALRVDSNTTLAGAGMGQTVIKLADGATSVTGIIRTDSGQTLADGSFKTTHNVTIRDLTIDGNQANTSGDVDGFYSGARPDSGLADSHITLDQVEITQVSRYGFDPHEGTEHLTITNSVAHHNGRDGFTIDGSEHVVFANNIAHDNGRHGINIVTGSRDVLIENSQSFDNGSSGLVIQTGDNEIRAWTADVTVIGGSFDNNARYGIEARQTQDLTITNVAASGNGYHGIILSGVTGADLAGNALSNNNGGGSQLRLKNYVQDFDDSEAANDRVIMNSDIIVDGVEQPVPTNDLHLPVYDWVITPGDDTITGTDIADTFAAGDGDDFVFGAGGDDTIAGNAGDDTLDGGAGNDVLMGNIGDDTLLASEGVDTLDGGHGFDTADFSSIDSAVYVDLKWSGVQAKTSGGTTVSKKTATTDVAELIDIEAVVGTNHADKLLGSNGVDTLIGGEGNDVINGRSGSDTLLGEAGNDKLRGGGGADNLDGGTGNDDIRGGGGNDIIAGGTGDDTIYGGSGSDQFVFADGWGADVIRDFSVGQDKIAFEGVSDLNSFDDLGIADVAGDAVISFGGDQIMLDGIAAASLTANDFLIS